MEWETMNRAIANDLSYIEAMQGDEELRRHRDEVYAAIAKYRYTYNFNWLGRPIIQLPDDILMIQEIVFRTQPDVIIETGVAHGGSLVLSASMLQLLDKGEVIGIDIEIRPHNRKALQEHFLSDRISLIEGSSIDEVVVRQVRERLAGCRAVMVFLDSNHTHEHVLRELELYSPLVTKGSYLVVFDTGIDDVPEDIYPDRPWGKGNNPKTAVRQFLKGNDRFEVDVELEKRLMFSAAPQGYLKCLKASAHGVD